MSNQNKKQKTENEPLAESLNTLYRTKSSLIISPKDINVTFENFLPPHTSEEKRILEENIKKVGEIRTPLSIWKKEKQNILIDGILRHQIALKLNLDCPVVFIEFETLEDAKAFVLSEQLGRRNISDFYRCELSLQLADYYKNLGRERQSLGGQGCHIKDEDRIDAKKILGEKAGVSHDTLAKAKKILKDVSDPQILDDLRKGDRTISNVYNEITGKNLKKEPIQTELFDAFGGLIPDWSNIKSLTIKPSKDGSFKVEVLSKRNEIQVYETTNQLMVTETKPKTPIEDQSLLHLLYQEYDFDTISNPLWEDLRTLFIKDVRILHKYVSLQMDEKSPFRVFTEKLRLQLKKNWDEKHQPLGGGRKPELKIIRELTKFKDVDPSSIVMSDVNGNLDILNTGSRLTSGINQIFPEMMDTPTQSGTSPMDVIKDSEIFLMFMERVIVNDGLHLFTKSLEYKTNKLNNAA